MASLADRGAIPKQRVSVGENGSTNDLGDVKLNPSFKVEGRIRLSDGKPVPADTRLTLRRRNMVNMQDLLQCAAYTQPTHFRLIARHFPQAAFGEFLLAR